MIPREEAKNCDQQKEVLCEKLFISESGYAYHIDELIAYFNGEMKHKVEINGWNGGIYFHDFNNIKAKQGSQRICQLFSDNDVLRLLQQEAIREVINNNSNLAQILIKTKMFTQELIDLIKAVADHSLVIESKMPTFWSEGLSHAISQLIEYLNKHPKIAETLQLMTASGPMKEYSYGRGGEDIVRDLMNFVQGKTCGAGFQRDVSYVYAALQSARFYLIAMTAINFHLSLAEATIKMNEQDEKIKNAENNESVSKLSMFLKSGGQEVGELCKRLEKIFNQEKAPIECVYREDNNIFIVTTATKNNVAKTRSDKALVRDSICKEKLGIENVKNIDGKCLFYIAASDVKKAFVKLDQKLQYPKSS